MLPMDKPRPSHPSKDWLYPPALSSLPAQPSYLTPAGPDCDKGASAPGELEPVGAGAVMCSDSQACLFPAPQV